MTMTNLEIDLTEQVHEATQFEQASGIAAADYFKPRLSDQLMFRRANGVVVDKQQFLAGFEDPSPFIERMAEDIQVNVMGDRAMVTLIIRTVKSDGSRGRYRNIRLLTRTPERWVIQFWYNYDLSNL